MILSNTNLLCTLPSGHKAVYSIQPQHMNLQHWNANMNQVALDYGTQIAHQHGDRWYKAGGWDEITDLRTIALLERCPDAEVAA